MYWSISRTLPNSDDSGYYQSLSILEKSKSVGELKVSFSYWTAKNEFVPYGNNGDGAFSDDGEFNYYAMQACLYLELDPIKDIQIYHPRTLLVSGDDMEAILNQSYPPSGVATITNQVEHLIFLAGCIWSSELDTDLGY